MRDLDHATDLIAATVAAAGVPVTLKMRLGWDAGQLNAPELAHRAELAGVALVTVHGRTRCQFYRGKADWTAIRRVKEAIGIPVIANGDLEHVEQARHMLAQSGADGVMMGRGAYGSPWSPGMIARPARTGERGSVSFPARAERNRAAALRSGTPPLWNRGWHAYRAQTSGLVCSRTRQERTPFASGGVIVAGRTCRRERSGKSARRSCRTL